MKALAQALVDRRAKLASIVKFLDLAGKASDYSQIDSDGKPKQIPKLDMVRYGVGGVTFGDIALLLEDTKQLDVRKYKEEKK